MKSETSCLVVAVDGGGTRCRVAASEADARISVETGPANVSSDFDGAVREVVEGLRALAERLERPVEALAASPAFVGLAGVVGPGIAERIRVALPFRDVRIADDRPAALRGALGRRNGVIAHCGTGSFFAAQMDGKMRFSGGWGPVLGDEASAQWVGRAALRLTLESVDGRRAPSPLTEHLLSDHGDAARIVHFAGNAKPPEFGALAPLVTAYAGQGDPAGEDIMRLGAGEIARAVLDLGWQPGQALCLTGGIGPHFALYLPDKLRAQLTDPEGEPLDGAISLARDLAKGVK